VVAAQGSRLGIEEEGELGSVTIARTTPRRREKEEVRSANIDERMHIEKQGGALTRTAGQ